MQGVRRRVGWGLGMVGAWAILVGASPQEGEAPPLPSGFSEVVSVSYVLVPVAVRSPDGWVTDLEREDFRLFVEGREVRIDSFEHGHDSPVNLVFLQDLSGSMALGGALGLSRSALECFLDRGRATDEFALSTFADRRVFLDVPFTPHREVLLEAMEDWEAFGVTALYDAVAELPRIAPSSGRAKRAAVLITDGAENASETAPDVAAEVVRRAALPVYVLSLERPGRRTVPREADDPVTYAQLLRDLALATGGRYYAVEWPRDGERSCATIFEELRSRYILGFATGGGVEDYREIRVQVRRGGLTIRTRAGYRGPAPG